MVPHKLRFKIETEDPSHWEMEFLKVARSEATQGSLFSWKPGDISVTTIQHVRTDSGVHIHFPQPLPTGLAYKFQEYTLEM